MVTHYYKTTPEGVERYASYSIKTGSCLKSRYISGEGLVFSKFTRHQRLVERVDETTSVIGRGGERLQRTLRIMLCRGYITEATEQEVTLATLANKIGDLGDA